MLFYTVGQSEIFIAMLYAGMLVGLWYDALRAIRGLLDAGPYLSLAIDLVFSVGCAGILIGFMLRANYMDLRLFALLGALCGLILYGFTLGPLLRRIFTRIFRGLRLVIKYFMNITIVKKILK